MAITDFAKKYHEKMFPDYKSSFAETDPEFIERFDNFAFDEVVNQDALDDKTRFMAIIAELFCSCRCFNLLLWARSLAYRPL